MFTHENEQRSDAAKVLGQHSHRVGKFGCRLYTIRRPLHAVSQNAKDLLAWVEEFFEYLRRLCLPSRWQGEVDERGWCCLIYFFYDYPPASSVRLARKRCVSE